MNKNTILVSFILSLIPSVGFCSDLVAFPTGDAAWSADINQKGGNSPAVPSAGTQIAKAKHVEIVQFGKTRRTVITWSDGKTTERWSIVGLPVTFIEDPRNGVVTPRQVGSAMEAAMNRDVTYDAAAFTWVGPAQLVEKTAISYKGKSCYHFKGNASQTLPGQSTAMAFKREAWVDAKSLYPLAMETDDSLTEFKFQSKPPVGPLTPPPAFQKEISYYKIVMGVK